MKPQINKQQIDADHHQQSTSTKVTSINGGTTSTNASLSAKSKRKNKLIKREIDEVEDAVLVLAAAASDEKTSTSSGDGHHREMSSVAAADSRTASTGITPAAAPGYPYGPWTSDGVHVVDEQMSWGALWFPSWDVDYLGEAYHQALYNDVVLDDDIWDLRSITKVPAGPIERS